MRRRFLIFLFIAIGLIAVTASYAINRGFQPYLPAPPPGPIQSTVSLGGISGRVINAEGEPVSGVRVEANPYPLRGGLVRDAGTDAKGIFRIYNLEVGRYKLSVSKEEAGYADTSNHFYAAGFVEMPEVIVYANQTVSWGDIHLGPRAGKLIGSVREAQTKKLIASNDLHLNLTRVDDPNNSYRTTPDVNGHFQILVPPIPITFEVTMLGYEKKDLGGLRLKKGEIKRFDILLNPTK